MALSVRDAQSGTATSSSSVTVTKPTGLAVGDWMVAYVFTTNGSSHTVPTPSGWTSRGQVGVNDGLRRYAVFTKVADSSDVAASNFAFACGATVNTAIGHLLAVMDVGAFKSFEIDSATPSSGTVSFTASSTPIVTGSLVLLSVCAQSGDGSTTVSAYTTTPSNTFTEHLDSFIDSGSTDPVMAVASATSSSTSEITAYGASLSVSKVNHAGSLFLFSPVTSPTPDVSHLDTSPTVFAPTVSQVNVTTDTGHLDSSPTVHGTTAQATAPTQWQNEAKPITTWQNEQK